MGLTVHYDLKFRGIPEQVLDKLKRIRNIALDLPFKNVGEIWELDYSKDLNDDAENSRIANIDAESYRWAKIQYAPRYIDGLKGEFDAKQFKGWVFKIWVGSGCEPTNIGLISRDNKNWFGSAFTKTQYAEHFVKCHLLVISILDVCKKFGILKSVSDEGEYYETRDLSVLGDNINQSTNFIKGISTILKKACGDNMQIDSAVEKSENYVKIKKPSKIKNRI